MLFRQALLPEPVVPAISTWMRRVRSASTGLPVMSLPIHMASGEALTGRSPWMSPRLTQLGSRLGTSTPTADLPGMGACTRISVAASE